MTPRHLACFALGFFCALGPWSAPGRAARSATNSLRIIVQAGFLPNLPVLVRVEVLDSEGRPDWSIWDDEVEISTSSPSQTVVPAAIPIPQGRGSALITFSSDEDFHLEAAWKDLRSGRDLTSLAAAPVASFAGTLAGDQTLWQGVIRVTNDVTVPAGHRLMIEAGTLVLIDGVASGTAAPDLLVQGSLEARGTETEPITITCSEPGLNWGQIRHANAAPSLYQYTSITRGGRAAGEGHTGTGPVIRSAGSTLVFEQCTISDLTDAAGVAIGKIMSSVGGSDVTFSGCILARARMGPELSGTALLCTNTHVMNMFGPDDDDAIYVHSQNAGQRALIADTVVAFMDDDGVDTLGAVVEVRNCLIRDVFDKGTSVLGAETRIHGCLYVNCGIGISSKANNGDTVTTRISQTTIDSLDRGIAAENKGGGSPDATVYYWVTNSIIRTTRQPANSVYTDYDPADIRVYYSNLGESWPGPGNQVSDPMFADAAARDFHLAPFSPCIDQGDPASPPDGDGSRSDLGYAPFKTPSPVFSAWERLIDGRVRFHLHGYTNRYYRVEISDRLGEAWRPWQTNFLILSPLIVEDEDAADVPARFYRGRVEP